jgi:hypothetical protein
MDHLGIEVKIRALEVGDLGQATTGVDEQAEQSRVAALLERRPSHALRIFPRSSSATTGTGTSGTVGGLIRAIGDTETSSSSTAKRKNWRRAW